MAEQYTTVGVFLAFGVFFVILTLFIVHLVAPYNPTPVKLSIYECGEVPVGEAWVQYNVRFFAIALLFLLFEVDIALMYPAVAVYKKFLDAGMGTLALVEILTFVLVMFFGLVYAWRKGGLKWAKILEPRPM
jgi:NADH-quinone oxidoreductase subunit A